MTAIVIKQGICEPKMSRRLCCRFLEPFFSFQEVTADLNRVTRQRASVSRNGF